MRIMEVGQRWSGCAITVFITLALIVPGNLIISGNMDNEIPSRDMVHMNIFSVNIGRSDASKANQPPPEPMASGKICILVEPAKYAPLQDELTVYKSDLELEGYTVEIRTDAWADHVAIRNFLDNEWQSNGLVGCVIVGDLPSAWFELHNDFDEPGVYTCFPIDHYYTDLDGTWIDNNPSNGIYDGHTEPGPADLEPEIWLGRITIDSAWEDEVKLIGNYLNKTHEYRIGSLSLPHRALLYVDDDWATSASWWEVDLNHLYSDVTTVNDNITTNATDYAPRVQEGYEWIQIHCHANHEAWRHAFMLDDGVKGSGGNFTSWNLSEDGQVSLFSNVFTCGSANYTVPEYLCGWYIFTQNYGLGSIGSTKAGSMLGFGDFYEPLGNGSCIGDAFEHWFSIWAEGEPWGAGWENYGRSWFYGMTIIGDPTLSPLYEAPNLPPAVDLISPDGGEIWAGGSSQTILWNMSDIFTPITDLAVDIHYSTTGAGGPWIPLVTAQTGFSGTPCQWTWDPLPSVDSANCYVRVRATDDELPPLTGEDLSDTAFTMDFALPTVLVTSPDGGESLMGGGSWDITWVAIAGSNPLIVNPMIIEYSSTGPGRPWDPVATNEPNDGTYTWDPIPTLDASNCYIRVNVTDTGGFSDQDESDAAFEIDSTAPAPATNARAELTAPNHVTIYWDGSVSTDVDHYEIYYIMNNWDPTGDSYGFLVDKGLSTSHLHLNVGVNNPSSYSWQVRTYDVAGNEARTIIQAGKTGSTQSVFANPSGWFMLGSHLHQSDTSLAHVIQGAGLPANWDCVQVYDAVNGDWNSYLKGRPDSKNDLTDITNEQGFWLHVTASTRFATAGYVEDMNVDAAAGWNLVPYPYAVRTRNTDDIETDLIANCPNYVPGSLTIFDPTAPYRFRLCTVPAILAHGSAFWIQVTADCTWTVINY